MAGSETVWVDVLPSLRNFGAILAKEATTGARRAGEALEDALDSKARAAGVSAGRQVSAGLQTATRNVTKLGSQLEAARRKEADAAGRVRVEEAKLQDVRTNTNAKTSQLVTAEERLARAQRGLVVAQGNVATVAGRHAAAQRLVSQATGQVSVNTRTAAQRMTGLAGATLPVVDRLGRLSPAMARVRAGFIQGSSAASTMAGSAVTTGRRIRGVVDNVGGLGAGFRNLAATATPALQRVGGTVRSALVAPVRGISGMLGQFGLTAGNAFAIAGGAAVTAGIRFAATEQQTVMAFTNMMGSAQEARAFVGQLQQFAASTPFDLPSVQKGAQRLMAFGFEAERVLPTLRTIGDAVAGMGGSADDIDRLTRTIGQISAKGKVQSEELLQLTEAGIPAMRILANETGVSQAKMQEMVTKGVVPASRAIPQLLNGISEGTRGAAGNTQAFAGMMKTQSTTLAGTWSNFTDNVNQTLGNLVKPAVPVISSSLAGLTNMLGTLPQFMKQVATAGQPVWRALGAVLADVRDFVVQHFVPAIGTIWDAISPVVSLVGGAFMGALRLMGEVLSNVVGPALSWVVGLIKPLMPLIVGVGAAMALWAAPAVAAAGGMKILSGALKAAQLALGFVTGAWRMLSTAFATSPIGFVVTLVAGLVAAFIYAWNNFAGFREFWIGLWNTIKSAAVTVWNALVVAWNATWAAIHTAVMWVWTTVIQPVFNAIRIAFQAVGAAANWLWFNIFQPVFTFIANILAHVGVIVFTVLVGPLLVAFRMVAAGATWLWHNVISPAFNGIGAVVRWAWNNLIRPALNGIRWAIRGVGTIANWLWHNVFVPAWNGIGAIVRWAWNNLLRPAISGITWAVRGVGTVANWLWHNVFVPAWNGIGGAVRWAWTNLIRPAISGIRRVFSGLGQAASWLWHNALKPAWDGIGSVISGAWNNVIRPVLKWFGDRIQDIGDFLGDLWKTVKRVFNSIVDFVKKPIQGVIDIVWNNGLRRVYNMAADLVPGVDPLPELKLAQGGVLPGYAPGRDTVSAKLSPGEAVLVPELVRLLGAENIVAANKAAMHKGGRRPSGASGLLGFADGGVVGPGKPSAAPTAPTTPVTPAGLPDYATAALGAQQLTTAVGALTVALRANTVAAVANTTAWTQRTIATQQTTVATRVATRTLFGLTRAVNTQRVTILTGLLPVVRLWAQTINTVLVPALRQHTLHTGTLAVRANNRLWTSTSGLRNHMAIQWNSISSNVRGSVNAQNTAMNGLRRGMASVRTAATHTATWLRDRFAEMRGHAARPVRWILNWPMNGGLVKAWNRLNRDFRLNKHIGRIPVNFAVGGKVTGPGSATSDSIPANLSNNEYVVRAKVAKRVLPFLDALNSGQTEAMQAAGYAQGGVVADTGSALDAQMLRAQRWARSQNGKPYIWAGVGPTGYDCSGFQSAITNVLRGDNPHQRLFATSSFANGPTAGFARGLRSAYGIGVFQGHSGSGGIGHMAGTLGGVNVESGGSPSKTKFAVNAAGADDSQFNQRFHLPVVGGRFISGGGGGMLDPRAIVDQYFAPAVKLANDTTHWFKGVIPDLGKGESHKAINNAKRFGVRRLNQLLATTAGGSGGAAGSPAVVNAVRAVARRYGWGSGPQWAALHWLVGKESSWDPSAANPTSSARGLFQKMTSVHGPVEGTPAGQAQWGLNYIRGRYGDPVGAKGFHMSHGYYDEGGWLQPGFTPVYNGTGEPELVVPRQTANDLFAQLDSDGNGPQRPVVINVYPQPGQSEQAVAEMVSRRLKMAGRT